MIISISGLIGSGKDTIADYLVNRHGFRRESWAGTLKDAVSAVFGWDRDLLEGKTPQSRTWRELPDGWWSDRLEQIITPRRVLQEWGTDVARNGYHDQIWIASLENKLRHVEEDVVITDSRFPNEVSSVKRMGGITTRVSRGADPAWVAEYLSGGVTIDFTSKWKEVHASEYSSVGLQYDHHIDNNGSYRDLYKQVNDLLQHHRVSR